METFGQKARQAAKTAIMPSAILMLALAAFLLWPSSSPGTTRGHAPAAQDVTMGRTAESEIVASIPPADTPPPIPAPRKTSPAIEQPAGIPGLLIPEHGVGTGVIDHELVSESEQFMVGQRVWFWTLVEGGTAGESIVHVWLHEDKEVLRVPLKLGGLRWRTKSYKEMTPGSEGSWTVEARDEAGRLLASPAFTCTASRRP